MPEGEARTRVRRRLWIGGAVALPAITLAGWRYLSAEPPRETITDASEVRGAPLRSVAPPPGVSPPAEAPAAAPPPAAPVAGADGGYKTIGWEAISDYYYTPAAPEDATSAAADPPPPREDQIPEEIREMSGMRIAIDGYGFALDYDHGKVARFILMSAPLACCWVEQPPMNQWITVTNVKDAEFDYGKFDVVRVCGVFDVGEETREGYVVGIYRMRAEKVELVKE